MPEKDILQQVLLDASNFAEEHGEGKSLSVLAIYKACKEELIAQLADLVVA